MLDEELLVRLVVKALLAGVDAGRAHDLVEFAREKSALAFSPPLRFHRARVDQVGNAGFHFPSQFTAMGKCVESEEVERLQPGKGIFPEALDETKEGGVLNGAGKDEENLMGSGAGEIRQRLGLADGLLDHDRWH